MSRYRRPSTVRTHVVKACAEALLRFSADWGSTGKLALVEALHAHMPEATSRELRIAFEIASECIWDAACAGVDDVLPPYPTLH